MENEDGGWMSIKREEVAELIAENEKLRVVYNEIMLDDYIQTIAKQSLRDALKAMQTNKLGN